MAAVVRSLSSYKHLSQWWKCLGREKWYILADLHGRNPSERRAALLRSATGINDPQAMCARVSRQRQWFSIVMHSRYSKKTQPCYKVPLHEGQHCTKDCEEILKTLKSPTKRRFGCCWQSQGVLIVRHGTKKCLWRGFDSSLKVSILKINKSGYANCAFQVWDNKGCHRCFETEHKEEKVMFSWRWWDNMIYILFHRTNSDCPINLLHTAEVVKPTTQQLLIPRDVTARQKSPRHVVAWQGKPSRRIQIRQWVWHRGMLFMFIPLPSGSFRSTLSMFADSFQGTRLGCCQASLRSDRACGISERQAQKMKGLL